MLSSQTPSIQSLKITDAIVSDALPGKRNTCILPINAGTGESGNFCFIKESIMSKYKRSQRPIVRAVVGKNRNWRKLLQVK